MQRLRCSLHEVGLLDAAGRAHPALAQQRDEGAHVHRLERLERRHSTLVRAADDALLSRVGSPFYMSPEICRSQPYGPEADIWSLGCVLYECVCLCHAFYAETIAGVLARICAADYAPPPPVIRGLLASGE